VAETPVFIPKDFTQKLLETCESIIEIIRDDSFRDKTDAAIPAHLRVPGENAHTQFIAFDFGVCESPAGGYEPQLIEMQGFPSLFAYQVLLDDVCRKHFDIAPGFSAYPGAINREEYIRLLKEIILGNHPPEHVVLLEIEPHKQKTRVDFYCTTDLTGIRPVCITELIKDGTSLFYMRDGVKTKINRIYNRVIFDELFQQPGPVREKGKLIFEELDVEWVPHPSWFYRISKYTLPYIRHPFVPETHFLHQLDPMPDDLENYVLKPLFSFAGQGVIIDLGPEDIARVKDPENWILQRKVKYADVIATPDGPAKAEIRLFYFWKDEWDKPLPVQNLARLSKGKMIGVRYNKDREWVGGSYCLFEK
jgi:hypothetical protein